MPSPVEPDTTKKRPRLRVRLLAIVIASMAALLLGELAVRAFAPQPMNGSWRVRAPRGYAMNRASGTARHELPDGSAVIYRFNDEHLRGAALGPRVGSDALRVLCVGDSFTFGWMLEEQDTYLAEIERRADQRFGQGAFEFLNGGAGGWGTSEQVAFVEDMGERIAPDMVCLFMNPWDLGRSLEEGPYALKDDHSLELVETSDRSDDAARGPSPAYQWLLEHSHLVQFARVVVARTRTRRTAPPRVAAAATDAAAPPDAPVAERLGRALFTRLAAWCRSHRCALVVVTTARPRPARDERGASHSTAVTDAFKRGAPTFFAELGVPWHDVAGEIVAAATAAPRTYEIEGDGHPNAAGAALMASVIWGAIEGDLAALRAGPAASDAEPARATPR